jgi:hypothetical protein
LKYFINKWKKIIYITGYYLKSYRVSGLCPSYGILNSRKHDVSEAGAVSVLRRGEGVIYSVGSSDGG